MTASSIEPGGATEAASSGSEAPARLRLLLVSYHFPPSTAVGALRWAGLTRYLASLGWDTEVIFASSEKAGNSSSTAEVPQVPAIALSPVPPDRTLSDRYRSFREASARDPGSSNGHDLAEPPRAGLPMRFVAGVGGMLRRGARSMSPLITWPDEGRGWIRPARKAVMQAVRRRRPDLVLSSGPPHSAHLAVLTAGLPRDIPWILDFRDPWYLDSKRSGGHALSRGPLETRVLRWVEGRALRRAELALATTPEIRSRLAATHPRSQVHWLPNGIDLAEVPKSEESPFPTLAVVHLGTLYLNRDPTSLLEGFVRFLRSTSPEVARESVLRFVGAAEGEHRAVVERALRGEAGQQVKLLGYRPRKEALRLLQRSGLAVVLAQGQHEMVPAKIYESVALGVPTLVVTEPGSATARAADRFGLFRVDPDDAEGVARVLETVAGGARATGAVRDVPVRYQDLAQHLDPFLRSIATGLGRDVQAARLLQSLRGETTVAENPNRAAL